MSSQRKKLLSVAVLTLGLVIFYFLRGTIVLFFLFPIVAVLLLLIWTMPDPEVSLDPGVPKGDDPLLLKIRRLIIAIGLSIMVAGVVTLLPADIFWIVMGTTMGLILVYTFFQIVS